MAQGGTESTFRVGYVAILGRPNVGKSTLMNALLGQKLSIVSPKPQTTRHRILGILSGRDYQIVFFDTPGLLDPRYKLQEMMLKSAERAAQDADELLFLIEALPESHELDFQWIERLNVQQKPAVLAINKIDLVAKDLLLPLIDECQKRYNFQEIVPISALKQDGIDILRDVLVRYLPTGPPLYPQDMLTDHPERFFVAEIIREKIFRRYGEEIPYSTTVVIDEFKERPGAKDYIRASIYVEKPSQRKILIGKRGEALKRIGQEAREEIEAFLGRPVFLELWVGVMEKWRQREPILRQLGYQP
ncbi:MAG: GTPase Era [candidate division KSB1 bacterium]|nr:GTPase Era [candidate division KSB1 bacterium]